MIRNMFFGLAVLVASTAQAGFVIDDFSLASSAAGDVGATRNGESSIPSGQTVSGGKLTATGILFGTVDYEITPAFDFSTTPTFVLRGLEVTTPDTVTASISVDNVVKSVSITGVTSPTDYFFDYSGEDLSSVPEISFGIFGGATGTFSYSLDAIESVPEPATLSLVGLAVGGYGLTRRRRRAVEAS